MNIVKIAMFMDLRYDMKIIIKKKQVQIAWLQNNCKALWFAGYKKKIKI
jgi:hypothetical protein